MIIQKTKTHLVLIALVATTLSACSGETTSQDAEELKALWVLDADRHLQQMRVIARAVESGLTAPPSAIIFPSSSDFSPQAESGNDELFDQYFIDQFSNSFEAVRLTGKDVMHVVTASGTHQLYRRSKPLEYQTTLPFTDNSTDYELRLDYSSMRYPASVASARVFAVNNLNIIDADAVVARDDVIEVSWNIGDFIIANGEQFTQSLQMDLLSCNSQAIAPASTSITIPATNRSITLLTGQLPAPLTANGSAITAQGECTYGLQLQAHLAPAADTSTANTLDTTPAVLVISRSNQQLVSVAQ